MSIIQRRLRPGEKLFEELKMDGENVLPTHHDNIRRFESEPPDPRYVARWLERLRILMMEGSNAATKAHLLFLVPEYRGLRPAAMASAADAHSGQAVAARAS